MKLFIYYDSLVNILFSLRKLHVVESALKTVAFSEMLGRTYELHMALLPTDQPRRIG
jgi:hypothetical protein